jgi:UDPglucose 6-dehydrogenase
MTENPIFSIVGLGKLGASMLGAIARRGFQVIGVDVNPRCVEAINQGHAPVYETDLEAAIATHHDRIRATTDVNEAVCRSDLTFVVVPTPSDENGAFTLEYVAKAFRGVGKALAAKKHYHNVVLTSTVLPGATRYGLLPILEQESEKKVGDDFGLCYSPEFIALGTVIRDFLNPDFLLIGESDKRAGSQLEQCYRLIMENNPPAVCMSIENAELAKIALNSYLTLKITFANTLAAICEHIPGGNVDVVTRALGLDQRIGKKYLRGGLGYGGPCFPRDNSAFAYVANALGCSADLAETTDRLNRTWATRIVKRIRPWLKQGSTVAVLGLSYKPGTMIVEESQAAELTRGIARMGVKTVVYDPLARDAATAAWGAEIIVADSWQECVADADIAIVATPDPVFRLLRPQHFLKWRPGPAVVVDCWRLLEEHFSSHPGVVYLALGVADDAKGAAERLRTLWTAVSLVEKQSVAGGMMP